MFKPGDKLRNGATVVAVKTTGATNRLVVLALTPSGYDT